ncbi:uncharacterized protein VTP21DRAFT_8932 [Calcarisporiella thermophila]|uniref:uncharacterized protein n=1 Tax=Calcarisporiella thermophila TaxID=911321 RepID=UPI003742F04C
MSQFGRLPSCRLHRAQLSSACRFGTTTRSRSSLSASNNARFIYPIISSSVGKSTFPRGLHTSSLEHSEQSKSKTNLSTQISEDGLTHITTLSNGLRVVTENTAGHFAAVGVYVDAGSRYETPKTRGISHILDRLAFKNTEHRTAEEMIAELESLGGNIMCSSSREAIMYQGAIFKQDLARIISLYAEAVRRPLITPEEVAEQRETAMYEISEIYSKPDMILPELLHTSAFHENTLGNPLLCPPENLELMTPELIREYISTWYVPERIVIAAAGAPHDQVVQLVEQHFGDMPKSDWAGEVATNTQDLSIGKKAKGDSSLYKTITRAATSMLSRPPRTPQEIAVQRAHYTGGSLLLEQPDMPFTHVYVAFPGFSIHDPDIYSLATLQILMGGGGSFSAGGPGKGMYSRLFTRVLNQHYWVESCTAFNHCYTDAGLFGIAASCRPEYTRHLAEVIARELELVRAGGVTRDELNRAKNQLKSSLLMNLESRMVQLEDLGRQIQVHGRKITVAEMCERIDAVTLGDLVRICGRILCEPSTVVAQGDLRGLPDVGRVLEKYGLGKS